MIVGIRRIAPAIGIAATLVSSGIEAQSAPPNSYGTAFAVTKDGDLVTNAHVVAGCTAVTARLGATEFQGNVVVRDDNDDLALVHLSNQSTHFAFLRKRPEVRVGDTAITFGFPLPNALSHDGNLTVGYVSSLAGVSDNPTYLQVSTPIQPGSSGGSLLDSGGNVIGVVAKRMNPEKFPSQGDTAQLVNFAVSLKVLRTFLNRNQIALTERDSSKDLSVADVGDEARLFSYSVRCAPNNQMLSTTKSSGAEAQSDDTSERAVLYEEDLADGHGRRFVGSVAWRIEPLSAQGAHGPRVLRGDIHFLGQLNVMLIVSESLGENRQANCKIEVTFDTAQSARGQIVSVPGVLMKIGEETKGAPIVVRSTQSGPASFALLCDENNRQQNLKLLRERAWINLPIIYKDGHRAIIALGKGTSGLRAFSELLPE